MEDSSAERKTRPVYCFRKRNVLRFDLKESREGGFLSERKWRVKEERSSYQLSFSCAFETGLKCKPSKLHAP